MALTNRVLDSLIALAGAPLFTPDLPQPRGRRGMTPATASSISATDAAFAVEAAERGLAEIQLGELAADRARRDDIREFGRRMVDEHASANAELTRIAIGKRVTLPLAPSIADRAERDRLSALSADAFEHAFAQRMIADHEQTVALFERQRDHGFDIDLTAFAARMLPTLRDHLEAARHLSGNHGKEHKKGRKKSTTGR